MKLLYFLKIFLISTAWANPCGKEGSLEDRIKECNLTKGNFVLLARDEKNNEVYKDLKSGLLWGNRITSDFNHYGSQRACSGENPESQILKDLKWRLPTIKEFEQVAAQGAKSNLPHMNHWFWTSTPVKSSKRKRRRADPARAYMWDGVDEVSDTGDLKDGASVRCVAKP